MEVLTSFQATTHTYYAELLKNPPEGVAFTPLPEGWRHEAPGGALFWKARGAWQRLHGPNVDAWPEARIAGRPILAAQTIPLHRVPWALDLDLVSALFDFRHRDVSRAPHVALLRRILAGDSCRAITYWSQAARRGAERVLQDARIAAKGTLVRPAIDLHGIPAPYSTPRDADGMKVLFVGRKFEVKGGLESVEAALRLAEIHPRTTFTFVARLPPGYAPPRHPRIRFLSDLPLPALVHEFATSDVFLFPTTYEVFGLVVLEAFAHGLPVVTTDEFALREVVEDGVDGRVVKGYDARWYDAHDVPRLSFEELRARQRASERERLVEDLVAAVDDLLRDPTMRRRMGEAGRRKVVDGPYSVRAQRAALGEALRRLA